MFKRYFGLGYQFQSPDGLLHTTPTPERWGVANEHNQVVGADLASAATIAPTHAIHQVTGSAAIVNITPPWATFAGSITLIAATGAAWTWTAAGNISVVSTAAVTAQRAQRFTYVPATGKWYPDTITS
jgi:hypothetical protein